MGASNAANLARGAVLALAGLSLAACAGVGPRYSGPMRGYGGGYGGGAPETGGKPPSRYSGYHVGKPYEVNGRWYYPAEQPDYDEVGTASWYGEQFHNHYTADGEVFDMNIPTAAHKTLPLPCLVEVTNLDNGRSMVLRVNDRGPFVGDRLIDLSKEAAIELGYYGKGVTQVRVRYVGPAPDAPGGAMVYQAKGSPPPPRRSKEAPVQVASAPAALLGSDIDNRPLQASPSTMGWNAQPAPVAPPAPPAEVPPAKAAAPQSDAAPATATAQPASDIDDLLNQLAAGGPPTPPAVSLAPTSSAVQVGAYSSRANAERAAAGLQGQTQIVPVEQSGRVLYKVMLAQ
jgi:rare lipoprotein A